MNTCANCGKETVEGTYCAGCLNDTDLEASQEITQDKVCDCRGCQTADSM